MRRRGLLGSTAVVGANTLASRILGFARDVVLARAFGASAEADAFFVAFRIPNLFRRLFAEGAFSQAFVPVLAQYRTESGDAAVRALVARASGALGALLVLFTAAGIVAAPLLILAFAPGFDPGSGKFQLTVELLRVCFPYLLFISLTSLCAGVLNAYGRFGIPAFTPVLLNVCLIAAALVLAPRMQQPVHALAVGVFVAGIAQLALQLPFLWRLGLLVRPRLDLAHPGVRRIARLVVPALLGVSVAQINILVSTIIASYLEDGSVSWLYYSDRVMEFPLGVFGIALATVILPSLSSDHAAGSRERFSRTLDWALRLVALIAIPASVGLALLATPIVSTLFLHGAFDARDVEASAAALIAYAIGLPGFVAVKVIAPGFYARQEMTAPVRVAALAMLLNLVLSLLLVGWLAHVGLALATSVAALFNAGALLALLVRGSVYIAGAEWVSHGLRVTTANVVMGAALLAATPDGAWWLQAAPLARAGVLTVLVLGGGAAYVLVLLALGVRPRMLRAPRVEASGAAGAERP